MATAGTAATARDDRTSVRATRQEKRLPAAREAVARTERIVLAGRDAERLPALPADRPEPTPVLLAAGRHRLGRPAPLRRPLAGDPIKGEGAGGGAGLLGQAGPEPGPDSRGGTGGPEQDRGARPRASPSVKSSAKEVGTAYGTARNGVTATGWSPPPL